MNSKSLIIIFGWLLVLKLVTGCVSELKITNLDPSIFAAKAPPNSISYGVEELSVGFAVAMTPLTPTLNGSFDRFTIEPALITGLSFDEDTGRIAGTPTLADAIGTLYTITAISSQETLSTQIRIKTLTVPSALSYATPSPTYVFNSAITPNTASVTGELISFSVSPSLPEGLTLDSNTGTISGTPVDLNCANSNHTVTATNLAGSTTAALTIRVNSPPRNLDYGATSFSTDKYQSFNLPVPSSDGCATTSYSILPATLPTGLSFNTTTGRFSGTPTQSDSIGTDYTITATNAFGSTSVSINFRVEIAAYTWLGQSDSDWSNNLNWSRSQRPSSTDQAIFDDECSSVTGGQCNVQLSENTHVHSIQMRAGTAAVLTQNNHELRIGSADVSNPGLWLMAGGEFIGGSGELLVDRLHLDAGDFQSSSQLLRLGYDVGTATAPVIFRLGASASFDHASGVVRWIGSGGGDGGNGMAKVNFQAEFNQVLNLYQFELNLGSDVAMFDGFLNTVAATITGTHPQMNVSNHMVIFDGYIERGDVFYQGSSLDLRCDHHTTHGICSGIFKSYIDAGPDTLGRVILNGTSAQVINYQDGAGLPHLVIDNSTGVTTSNAGQLRLSALTIEQNGVFTAPSSFLTLGRGTWIDQRNHFRLMYLGEDATFNHNNGTVRVEYNGRHFRGGEIESFNAAANPIDFYNFDVRLRISSGRGYLYFASTPTRVMNDFSFRSGRLQTDSTFRVIEVFGNYSKDCITTTRCSGAGSNVAIYLTGGTLTDPKIMSDTSGDRDNQVRVINDGYYQFTGEKLMQSTLRVGSNATLEITAGASLKLLGDFLIKENAAVICDNPGSILYSSTLDVTTTNIANDSACYEINNRPTVATVAGAGCPLTIDQNTPYVCDDIVTDDDDSDPVTLSFVSSECPWLSFSDSPPTVSGTPTNAHLGQCGFQLTPNDGKMDGLNFVHQVTVQNVLGTLSIADAPSMSQNAGLTVIRSDAQVQASEEGIGSTSYSFDHAGTTAPRCVDFAHTLTINSSNGAVSFRPNGNFTGTHGVGNPCYIRVGFDDGSGDLIYSEFGVPLN